MLLPDPTSGQLLREECHASAVLASLSRTVWAICGGVPRPPPHTITKMTPPLIRISIKAVGHVGASIGFLIREGCRLSSFRCSLLSPSMAPLLKWIFMTAWSHVGASIGESCGRISIMEGVRGDSIPNSGLQRGRGASHGLRGPWGASRALRRVRASLSPMRAS